MASYGGRGGRLKLMIRQGATLGPATVTLYGPSGTPIDLTGAEIRAAIRKDFSSDTAYTLTCEVTDALAGQFSFVLDDEVTASMPCGPDIYADENQYVWDLEIEYPDGRVVPVLYGPVTVAPEATR